MGTVTDSQGIVSRHHGVLVQSVRFGGIPKWLYQKSPFTFHNIYYWYFMGNTAQYVALKEAYSPMGIF